MLAPVVAGATPASAAASVTCTSNKAGLAAKLSKDITSALSGRSSLTAVALYDRSTGTKCELRATDTFDSASVVKATVLATLLWDAGKQHRSLTSNERALATKMITASDNDSTTALWKQLGTSKVSAFLQAAGMTQTTPGSGGYWGLTRITARDQAKLLALLTSRNSVLSDDAREYELGLMNRVQSDQRWGTPRAPRAVRPCSSRTAGCRAPRTAGGCTASAPSPTAATTTASPSSPRTTAR